MSLPVPIASFRTTITDKITSAATSILIDSTTDDDANSMDTLVLFFVIDKGLSTEEYILGTVDTSGSQLTTVTRGLSVADGVTSVANNKFEHSKKAFIEISDHPYLTRVVRMLNGTEAVGGVMQNPASRLINSSRDLADKEYVDLTSTTAGGITAFATTDAGGITIDVGSGYLVTADGTVVYAGNSGFSLTDDATNYIELTLDGTLVKNTSSFTVGYVPIAIVTTVATDITVLTDARGWLAMPSGDILVTNDATYGATIAALDVLYLDTADAKWKLADASAEATADGQIGIAIDAGSDTDTNKRVQIGGLVTGLAGLTAGWVFLSDTAGDHASAAGTYKKIIGWAINATTMFLVPTLSADELTGGNSSLTVANLNEAMTFFANTDITGAQAETLSDASDASTLHYHDTYENAKTEVKTNNTRTFVGSRFDGMTEVEAGTGVVTRFSNATVFFSTASGDDAGIHSGATIVPFGGDFTSLTNLGFTWAENPNFSLFGVIKFSGLVTQDFFFGFSDSVYAAAPANAAETVEHAAFMVEDGTIYASISDGVTQERSDVTGAIVLTAANNFEVISTGGTNVVFKINGTTVATLSTKLPDGANSPIFNCIYTGQSASDQAVLIKHPFAYKLTNLNA